ncbi:hypothetical protein MD535_25505 [Vibrio sp. ZSDZ65]|uniref:Uncharacterized protein n=1 Tax=Vibrio qingdaonensis TaxID=2829491 RepID=A0A9X3CVR4_9VIBR|nr:hypothetical protein [Vibrio qingdaonensis]MCW8349335.1 hypothetical protein [Vibrio qingdaonensis]
MLRFILTDVEVLFTTWRWGRIGAVRFFLFDDKNPNNFDQRLEMVLDASENLVELYKKNVIKPLVM